MPKEPSSLPDTQVEPDSTLDKRTRRTFKLEYNLRILQAAMARKQEALDLRYALNPERFVRGRPTVKLRPSEVAINPISDEYIAKGIIDTVNFPTLRAAGYVSNAI